MTLNFDFFFYAKGQTVWYSKDDMSRPLSADFIASLCMEVVGLCNRRVRVAQQSIICVHNYSSQKVS